MKYKIGVQYIVLSTSTEARAVKWGGDKWLVRFVGYKIRERGGDLHLTSHFQQQIRTSGRDRAIGNVSSALDSRVTAEVLNRSRTPLPVRTHRAHGGRYYFQVKESTVKSLSEVDNAVVRLEFK